MKLESFAVLSLWQQLICTWKTYKLSDNFGFPVLGPSIFKKSNLYTNRNGWLRVAATTNQSTGISHRLLFRITHIDFQPQENFYRNSGGWRKELVADEEKIREKNRENINQALTLIAFLAERKCEWISHVLSAKLSGTHRRKGISNSLPAQV